MKKEVNILIKKCFKKEGKIGLKIFRGLKLGPFIN